VLIGRDHPAGVLRAELSRAASSHGGLVLVTGEAGIGKTTLVTGVVEEARRSGALVLSGACWDSESAPGYWPWTQVIRALRRTASPEEWATAEEAAGTGLAVLLGESRPGQVAEGFPLFDAVASGLVAVSHRRPVVVVLDDLHWADAGSLKLLAFAAQHTWFERLLMVGTYRDTEVEVASHPARPLLLPLATRATVVSLTGLGRDDVADLMARTVGRRPDDAMAAEVHRRTGGNPFFVEQTARLWHAGGAVTAIAPGIRDALLRRLSLLPRPVSEVLTVAAVLGREFHHEVLAAIIEAPVRQADRLLDQAVTARLVVTLGAGRFAFVHDLVRETLYGQLDVAEARRRHAAVVRAIDGAPDVWPLVVPADLAGHAYLSGDELPADRVIDLLLAARRDAGSRMAFEERLAHQRRAHERAGSAAPHRRIAIALELADALNHWGEATEAARVTEQAVAVAREAGDPHLLARVALAVYRSRGLGPPPPLAVDLLGEVHRVLTGDDLVTSPGGFVPELTLRVSEAARRSGDDDTLAFALWARHDAVEPLGSAPERVEITTELMDVARRLSDTGMEYFAASFRWVALLEQGDPGYLDQYEVLLKLTEREGKLRSDLTAAVDTGIIATLTGRFGAAEDALDRVDATAFDGHGNPHFGFMLSHLRWALWLAQGRFDELAGWQGTLVETGHPHHDLLAAVAAVESGDVDPALRYLSTATEPSGYLRPLWLRCRAQVAAASGDVELCEQVRAALEPLRGQWLVSLFGCDISGPVDLWRASLDAAQGRWPDAVEGFAAAHESAERLRARPWSIRARAHLAQALLGRAGPGDAERAAVLLDEVTGEAAEIGMRGVLEQVRAVPAGRPPEPQARYEFRREGAVWLLRFDGRAVHVPDAKGLHDLHTLLSRPGSDVPAVRLRAADGGEVAVAAARLGGDPILDDEAKARYKRRLGELDEQIDRAATLGRDAEAAELDRERQALIDELRAATGLGGRSRRLGDEAERARKTVTARIRDLLRRLDDQHPALAGHLRGSVSTGLTCRYHPDQHLPWRL
jgi:hypothetical protein